VAKLTGSKRAGLCGAADGGEGVQGGADWVDGEWRRGLASRVLRRQQGLSFVVGFALQSMRATWMLFGVSVLVLALVCVPRLGCAG
jgi:hypothetical protein